MVYECLKHGGSIAKSEEHDSGFKESHGSDESSFPLVFFLNVDVVVSPVNVKPGEQGGFFHVINEFRNKGKRVCVSGSMGVQVVIVPAWI